MKRILALAFAIFTTGSAASAATIFEDTPNETAGGFDIFALPGSSLVGNSDPFVAATLGAPGVGFAINGVENFRGILSGGGLMSSLSFQIFEPTTTQLAGGCNTTCFDSEFTLTLLFGGTVLDTSNIFPLDDAITTVNIPAGSFIFDEFIVREVSNTIDNEFFGNFSAEVFEPPVAAVPLPAGGGLLLGALALLALRRRS